MISKITWSEYWIAVVLCLIAYYLIVLLKYYGPQVKEFIFKQANNGSSSSLYDDSEADINELEDVVRDLRYAIFERAALPLDKTVILKQLKQRLSGYRGLGKPAFRVALNNQIILQAKEVCGLSISAAELNSTWDSEEYTGRDSVGG
ncbi:hypothetical protein [Mucilaginibacter ginsenosidivorans]|uniref:Uncharacterized protein n=1 Tax=Mucilaginibacter ginsenosidivorans TaxID=398053 RepID=A0A5B8USJ9_9SPHI|nr:hypothetical protein [Mucilaginibacter ginsenosidivorans]QEC61923.1 hypothetical protein FRZ54_04765 [Mucilaginibacter ginsenosidivorans]